MDNIYCSPKTAWENLRRAARDLTETCGGVWAGLESPFWEPNSAQPNTTVFLSGLAILLLAPGCEGGVLADASCTVVEKPDGRVVVECPDGTSAAVGPASTCSAVDNHDGSITISCTNGTSTTVDTSCTLFSTCDGVATMTCPDGTELSWNTGIRCSVVAGFGRHTCAIRPGGRAVCWGSGLNDEPCDPPFMEECGQAKPPDEVFVRVEPGARFSCGLRARGDIVCWGYGKPGDPGPVDGYNLGQAVPPPGEFVSLSVGPWHSCGIRADKTVECWGSNIAGELDAPSGEFEDVSVGCGFSAGLRADGTVGLWGSDRDTIPGKYLQISGGCYAICGLLTDHTIACQDDPFDPDPEGEYIEYEPEGEYIKVTTGDKHACALAKDGSVACWGHGTTDTDCSPDNTYPYDRGYECGQAVAPEGPFVDVSAGFMHTCGLRPDGSVECWGAGTTYGDGECTHEDWECGQAAVPEELRPR